MSSRKRREGEMCGALQKEGGGKARFMIVTLPDIEKLLSVLEETRDCMLGRSARVIPDAR